MNFLRTDYLQQLTSKCTKELSEKFRLYSLEFSDFETINTSIVHTALTTNIANLLITVPDKEKINELFLSITIPTILNSISANMKAKTSFNVGDILLHKTTGKISTVKAVSPEKTYVLPLGTLKRIEIENNADYIVVCSRYSEKIEEIKYKQAGIKNFQRRIFEQYKVYEELLSLFLSKQMSLPSRQCVKTVVVTTKNECINKIPRYLPFQYINKHGESSPNTDFDPVLILANDFKTIKEHIIDKDIVVDTMVFFGDNKFIPSISAISKCYRQNKIQRCIFIGTPDANDIENLNTRKWQWTLGEIKFLNGIKHRSVTTPCIKHPELTEAITEFSNLLISIELRYQGLINLKKLLKFIRKVFPITALQNDTRIRERANENLECFEKEAQEEFQDEYYNIDVDYKEDYEALKAVFEKIIKVVKKENKKAEWLANAINVDFIVVPKPIKKICEEEILRFRGFGHRPAVKANDFTTLSNLFSRPQQTTEANVLMNAKVISVKEFFNRGNEDERNYLFLSLYSNGMHPELLLQKMLASNLKTQILCYEEEVQAFKYYVHKFQANDDAALRSTDRKILCDISYPEGANINQHNIDDWIKDLVEFDEFRLSKRDEPRHELYFEEDTKPLRERSTKMVYIREADENFKEIRQLGKGDKVRIYRPPSNELLHDLIEMTDETNFFERVNRYSLLWKLYLQKYYLTKYNGIDFKSLYLELVENKLSVDEYTLKIWLEGGNKTKFPKRKRDIGAILKTVGQAQLLGEFLKIMKEYYGQLPKRGNQLRDEVDNYLITGETGKMLKCLGQREVEELLNNYAPVRTIKEIKLVEEQLID